MPALQKANTNSTRAQVRVHLHLKQAGHCILRAHSLRLLAGEQAVQGAAGLLGADRHHLPAGASMCALQGTVRHAGLPCMHPSTCLTLPRKHRAGPGRGVGSLWWVDQAPRMSTTNCLDHWPTMPPGLHSSSRPQVLPSSNHVLAACCQLQRILHTHAQAKPADRSSASPQETGCLQQHRTCSGTQAGQGMRLLAALAAHTDHQGRSRCTHHSSGGVVQGSAQVQQHLGWPHRMCQHVLPGDRRLPLQALLCCGAAAPGSAGGWPPRLAHVGWSCYVARVAGGDLLMPRPGTQHTL